MQLKSLCSKSFSSTILVSIERIQMMILAPLADDSINHYLYVIHDYQSNVSFCLRALLAPLFRQILQMRMIL